MKKSIYVIRNVLIRVKYGKRVQIPFRFKIERGADINVIEGNISVGKSVWVLKNVHLAATFGGNLSIGCHVFINRNCIITSRNSIVIGNRVSFGPNVCIYDHDHKFDYSGISSDEYKTAPVVIEDNCWIGAGTIILRGTHIGEGSVIGAGCVIKGDIPPHSLVTMDRTMNIREIEEC